MTKNQSQNQAFQSTLKIDSSIILPPGPIRESSDSSFKDIVVKRTLTDTEMKSLTAADATKLQDQTISSAISSSNWAVGLAINPYQNNPTNYTSYTGIGASIKLVNRGNTSFTTPATYLPVTINLKDAGGHIYGLQNALGWGTNTGSTTNYVNSIWVYDITNSLAYSKVFVIPSNIINNTYELRIYFDTPTGKWYFQTYDGTLHSIDEITAAPSAVKTSINAITTASKGQIPIVLESYDTTVSDFNAFNVEFYGTKIRDTGGTWILAATSPSTKLYGYSYYANSAGCGVEPSLQLVARVGGSNPSPTVIGIAGNWEYVNGYITLNIGPGIAFVNPGYPNYWCNISTTQIQPTQPSGYGYGSGSRIW